MRKLDQIDQIDEIFQIRFWRHLIVFFCFSAVSFSKQFGMEKAKVIRISGVTNYSEYEIKNTIEEEDDDDTSLQQKNKWKFVVIIVDMLAFIIIGKNTQINFKK